MQIQQFPFIPRQAFLYFPQDDEIYQMRNGQPFRVIFEGGVGFKTQELAKLNDLRSYIRLCKQNEDLGEIKESILLRFLQAAKFDFENCVDQLKRYKLYQDSFLPFSAKPDIETLLAKGYFYLTGRDVKFRPIIVIDALKMLNADLGGKTFYEIIGYFFQFIVQNCLIQGHVQNWITIVDLGKLGILSLTGSILDSIKSISNLFKCRLHKSYLVNCPGSMTFFYGILKRLMTEEQANKIGLTEETYLPIQAFKEISQDEVEQKYGGKKKDIVSFWPPQSKTAQINPQYKVRLVSIEEYGLKYQKGLLNKSKVNKDLLLQYQSLKNKRQIKKSQKQLIRGKMQVACKKSSQPSKKESSQASDEDEPPEIHVIPRPFQMKNLFQFDAPI